jgi:hypothetical protein
MEKILHYKFFSDSYSYYLLPVVLYHRILYLYVHTMYVANHIDTYITYVCTTYEQVCAQSTYQENDLHRDHMDRKIPVGPGRSVQGQEPYLFIEDIGKVIAPK